MSYKFETGRNLHSFDGKPLIGVTTGLSIMDKPELTWWASGMACAELGWLNTKKSGKEDRLVSAGQKLTDIKGMDIKTYLALLDKAYSAHNTHKKEKAGTGKNMHALLEEFIGAKIAGQDEFLPDETILPFVTWSNANVKKFLFSELNCYSRTLWCGGIADFGYVDMDGNYVLGDFKSSNAVYFTQWAQCGAYDILIGENGGYDSGGNKVYESTFPFKYHAIFAAGMGLDKPTFNYDTIPTREAFCHALSLYKSKLFFEAKA